jgi:hypothetical protein
MQQRLAPGERHDQRTELRQVIDARLDHIRWYGLREVVVLVAVAATQVATPRDDELCQKGTFDIEQGECSTPQSA